ncbi:MAG: hypothetical protein R8G33_03700 [Gammaproteobacteria bacterium]|nr:hypothetical protein [Gammaproteobacteria bacterium]
MTQFKFIVEDKERRVREDRRLNLNPTTFPVFTTSGTWIRKECRKTPERRIENINVTETQIEDEEFNELFKEFS